MLKPGVVVKQDKVFIDNRIEAGNERRFSVVLFSENIDGEDYVCSCPITSTIKNIKKNPQCYCYIPYMLLGSQKLGVVRVSDLYFWKDESVHPVGLEVQPSDLQKIYKCVLKYKPGVDRVDVFATARKCINLLKSRQKKEPSERAKVKRKLQISGGVTGD